MNSNDLRRGDSQGYQGTAFQPAQSNAERFGRAQGAARRQAEIDASSGPSADGSGIPARYAILALLVGAIIIFGARMSAQALDAAGLLAASIVGLLLTPLMARLLRFATPVYAATLCGLGLGALSLLMRGTPVTNENIFIYPVLGAVFGVLCMIILLGARRGKRAPPPTDTRKARAD